MAFERKSRQTLVIAAGLTAVLVVLWFGTGMPERWARFWEIDACLDAGGGWDHQTDRCDQG